MRKLKLFCKHEYQLIGWCLSNKNKIAPKHYCYEKFICLKCKKEKFGKCVPFPYEFKVEMANTYREHLKENK